MDTPNEGGATYTKLGFFSFVQPYLGLGFASSSTDPDRCPFSVDGLPCAARMLFSKTNLRAAQLSFYDAFLGLRDFHVGNRSTPGYSTAALQAGLRGPARSVARFTRARLRLRLNSFYVKGDDI